MELFLIYISTILLIYVFATRGEPDGPEALMWALIPGLNLILLIAVPAAIIERLRNKQFKCIIGHDYEYIEKPTSKVPARVAMGGFETYKCTKCKCIRTVKWSAF